MSANPASGGRYRLNPDGSRELIEEPTSEEPAAAPPPPPPAPDQAEE